MATALNISIVAAESTDDSAAAEEVAIVEDSVDVADSVEDEVKSVEITSEVDDVEVSEVFDTR